MSPLLIHTALAFGWVLASQAAEPGKSQPLRSPDQVSEGLQKSDWQSIRQAYQAAPFNSALSAGLTTQLAFVACGADGLLLDPPQWKKVVAS